MYNSGQRYVALVLRIQFLEGNTAKPKRNIRIPLPLLVLLAIALDVVRLRFRSFNVNRTARLWQQKMAECARNAASVFTSRNTNLFLD